MRTSPIVADKASCTWRQIRLGRDWRVRVNTKRAARGGGRFIAKTMSHSTTAPAVPEKPNEDVSKPDQGSSPLPQPAVTRAAPKRALHPSIIIPIWIALSSSVIVYNKCVRLYAY